jgi:hypothetical protein
VSKSSMISICSEANFGSYNLFHTRDGRAFVDLKIDAHRETLPVRSDGVRRWLERQHIEHTGLMPSSSAVGSAIRLLEGRAHEGPEREVHIRVADHDGRVFLDLADDRGRVVEVGPDGWRVIDDPPVHFLRGPEMRPLPVPEAGGSIDMLRSLINVDDDAFVLITSWLLDAIRAGYEHPILVVEGAEGSAKSTLLAILQASIDPTFEPTPGLPCNERELVNDVGRGYLRAYDNVSGISTAMSNALCRLVTAGGPPIVMTGMERMVLRRDLADRCVFVTCESKEHCLARSVLLAEIERLRPKILGVILDILCHGLCNLPSTETDGLTRMADFELWANACETGLWPKGTFSTAYRANRAAAAEDQLDADPVASAVRVLMASRFTWAGNATKLYLTLAPTFETMGSSSGKPVSPRDLSVKLRKAVPSLAKIGIDISFDRHGHSRDRVIAISVAADAQGTESDAACGAIAPHAPKPSSAPSATQSDVGFGSSEEAGVNGGGERLADHADNADDADACPPR